ATVSYPAFCGIPDDGARWCSDGHRLSERKSLSVHHYQRKTSFTTRTSAPRGTLRRRAHWRRQHVLCAGLVPVCGSPWLGWSARIRADQRSAVADQPGIELACGGHSGLVLSQRAVLFDE